MDKYEFHTIQQMHEGELYKHVLLDKTLYISCNGKLVAELKDTDVMAMLKSLGIADEFRKGFNR